MVMITMDAHSRDTIKDLVTQEVSDKSQFQWSRQLRQSFDAGKLSPLFSFLLVNIFCVQFIVITLFFFIIFEHVLTTSC